MLKWAMRIVAVGGALLALAVGGAAGMYRMRGQRWLVSTPAVGSTIVISPRHVVVEGWRRVDGDDSIAGWNMDRYEVKSDDWDNDRMDRDLRFSLRVADFARAWHGFGITRDLNDGFRPSETTLWCPTWSLTTVLLLPMGLWAGIGWRQRRLVKAGRCVNCGYDLRATPEKCPECGRAVGINAE